MSDAQKGQVIHSAAEIYEQFFIPALFIDWPQRIIDLAGIESDERVLDVACGTGILARKVAEHIGSSGSVVGLDVNPGMLAVAARQNKDIIWRQGVAEDLPFDDASFDAVVSQFGLMFFEDRGAAIAQMARVLKPGGTLAIAVWDSLENTPGYAMMVDMLQRLFGKDVGDALRAPYNLGDAQHLRNLFADAPLTDLTVHTLPGEARFPSIDDWVFTDIKGWVLADVLDDQQVEVLLQAARQDLSKFVTAEGQVAFEAPAHIVTARKL
ncbi:MAG: methyltransferase domain-containing protein [Anaerolineaceae bacterium]|nr:methyltransferase domain-containing protein [Anaerolineaceae bacterium]